MEQNVIKKLIYKLFSFFFLFAGKMLKFLRFFMVNYFFKYITTLKNFSDSYKFFALGTGSCDNPALIVYYKIDFSIFLYIYLFIIFYFIFQVKRAPLATIEELNLSDESQLNVSSHSLQNNGFGSQQHTHFNFSSLLVRLNKNTHELYLKHSSTI